MKISRKDTRNPIQPRDWPIAQLPGLSQEDRSQLIACGIATTLSLARQAATPEMRLDLADRLQVRLQSINKWVALAELASIPSVGCQYCGLVLHAGVCSKSQLATTPVHRLHQQILRLQVAMMQRRDLCPPVDKVKEWVEQAQFLSKLQK